MHAAEITFTELTWDLSWTTHDGKDRTPVIPARTAGRAAWAAKPFSSPPFSAVTFPVREGRRALETAGHPHPPGKTVLIVC